MGIRLRIVEPFPEEREPGMMWRYERGDRDGRECWWIMLPGDARIGTPGHPSQVSWRTTDRAYDGSGTWAVSGEPPNLTVSPSIDVLAYRLDPTTGKHVRDGSYWHGFIRNGELDPA